MLTITTVNEKQFLISGAHSRLIRRGGIFFLILLVCACNLLAQVGNGTSAPVSSETANKADQNHKSISRINPNTLAMEMSLPLMTYPGRNGNSLPVGFSYSSKIWRVETGLTWWYWLNTQPKYVTDVYARFAERSAAGWTSNLLSPRIEVDNKLYDQNGQPWEPNLLDEVGLVAGWQDVLNGFLDNLEGVPCGTRCTEWTWVLPGANYGYCSHYEYEYCWDGGGGGGGGPIFPEPPPAIPLYYIRRLHIAMPDGSNHEFRASDTTLLCGTNYNVCTRDMTGTYLSVDGTGMRLVRTASESTLYLSNGSKYVFTDDDAADSYFDANGNKLTFSRTTNSTTGAQTNRWVDTLGREIVDPMPHNWLAQTQSAGKQSVALPGLDGQDQEYEITWANLKPRGCEEDTTLTCTGANNVIGGALDDQSQKLYYETKYFCRGNISENLVTQTGGEVLFPEQESGIRPCSTFDVQRNSSGALILDEFGDPIPYAPRFNPVVLSEVKLPNGGKYELKYNRFGEITKITYPTGSYETFVYGKIAPVNGSGSPAYDQTNRGVTEHRIYDSSNDLQQKWSYSVDYVWASGGNSTYKVTTRGPKGGDPLANAIISERSLESIYSSGGEYGFENPLAGTPKEERAFDENGVLRKRTISESEAKGIGIAKRDVRVKRSVSIMFEPSSNSALATLNETDYDDSGNTDPEYFSHLNVKRTKAYQYAVIADKTTVDDEALSWTTIESWFPESKMASVSETDYSYDSNYKARGITSRPLETRVLNPTNLNDVLGMTQFVYDEELNYPIINAGTDAQWTDPGSNLRGNVTTTKTWVKESDTWLSSHAQYDNFGNLRKAWDASGDANKYVETNFGSEYHYAYPTSVTTPAPDPTNTTGTNGTSTVTTTYDFTTGLPMSVTDDFGQTTKTEYDNMLRPTRAFAYNFTAPESQTVYGVPDPITGTLPESQRFVKVRKQIDATNWDEATTWFDGLGRTIKTIAKDSQGDVIVESHYDNLGRVDRVTNPYRAGETVYWSKTRYDVASRAVETYAPTELSNLANAVSLGVTSFDISSSGDVGTVVTTTDASGRKSRSITNALGQLIRVDEPTGISAVAETDLGSLTVPVQPTNYTYDVFGKMVKVQQGGQFRYFKYDALGRLLRVRQPEQEINLSLATTGNPDNNSWTAGFAYDLVGNVVRAIDANGVNIISEYDRASRVTKRCYTKPNIVTSATTCAQVVSNGDLSTDTPSVEFYYDGKGLASEQSPNFAKGKLTKVTSSVSETRYKLFDNFGRLKEMEQRTPVDSETVDTMTGLVSNYTYNFAGALIEEEYPSGRKVKNEFEPDGDLARVTSAKNATSPFLPYVSDFSYTASGGISRMRLGNGRWETAKFNERLQVTELGLGASATDTGTWKVNYAYGELEADGSVTASKNTGNIAKQTLSFTGLTNPIEQAYKYDSLYRLTEAKESANSTQNWVQNWTYDRYGNRSGFSQNIAGNSAAPNPTVDPSTNRFEINQGFHYDKNGNVTQDVDPVTAQIRTFVFNGDNKQTEVKNASGVPVGRYYYDGEGKRVKKVTDTETTVFVYSSGKLVAEYSTQISQTPTIAYTTTDHLGSPRVITDAVGQVKSRRDFMPFGEDLFVNVGARSTDLKYGTSSDDVRQKFTGYQKDTETSLDFAEARMYENRFGRFTAVDPLLASGKSGNPKTFNRYVYIQNNPVNDSDPSGACPIGECPQLYSGPVYTNFQGQYDNVMHNGWGVVAVNTDILVNDPTTGFQYRVFNYGEGSFQGSGWERTSYGVTDLVADMAVGTGKWAYNGMASTSEDIYTVLSYMTLEGITTGRPRGGMPQVTYFPPSNQQQASTAMALTIVTIMSPAFKRSGGPLLFPAVAADTSTAATLGNSLGSAKTARGIVNRGGSFGELFGLREFDEVAHHMPQNAFMSSEVGRKLGPALGMTKADHKLTRTYVGRGAVTMRTDAGLTARQRMFKDALDIREQFGRKYNPGLIEMLNYANTLPIFKK